VRTRRTSVSNVLCFWLLGLFGIFLRPEVLYEERFLGAL
jgi:hypothetical protein